MQRLALGVLRALAFGLGQQANWFDAQMLPRGDPHLKLIRYRGEAEAQRDQGVGWHHDSGVLTFVLQDETGGLEVNTDSGVVAADPRPLTYQSSAIRKPRTQPGFANVLGPIYSEEDL